MATNIGTAFFDVSFNTVVARRELTALVSTANRQFGLLGGISLVAATTAVIGLTKVTVDLGQAGVDAFAEYEQAFASVRKVLDDGTLSAFNAGQMFGELSQELRDLGKELPLDLEDDIANIAAIGGQLGIIAPDIEEFTEVIGEIGVTTNVAVEDAATSFARLGNVLDVPSTEFREMGDTLVNLGNKLPATEDEILRFSARIAAAGEIAGFTADEVLAISAAFTSVGVPAERGGTAFQRVIIKITEAVAQGSEELTTFAEVAGLSADEFARLWREDASNAFTLFVEGLGVAGEDAFRILGELELNEQRTVQAMLALASAGDLTREVFQLAADDAGALATESSIFFGTTQSNIQLLENTAHDAAITIGEGLAPAFNNVVDAITNWITENDTLIRQIGVDLGNALEGLIPTLVSIVGFIADLISGWASFIETVTNLPTNLLPDTGGATGPDFDDVRAARFTEQAADFFTRGFVSVPEIAGVGTFFADVFLDAAGDRIEASGAQILSVIEDQVVDNFLRGGQTAIEATAQGIIDLDRQLAGIGERVTPFGIAEITDQLVLTEEQIKSVIETAVQGGARIPREVTDLLGITVPAGTHPRFGGEGFGQITPQISTAAGAALLDEFTFDAEEAEAAAVEYAGALVDIADAARDAGIPQSEFIANLQTLAPDLFVLVEGMDQATLAADLFNVSLARLGQDIQFDNVANLFDLQIATPLRDLIAEKITVDGEEVLDFLHGDEVVANILEQQEAIATAEAQLLILAAQGFENLVTELAALGPSGFHAIEDFFTGEADAAKAEMGLAGGEISAELQAQVEEALKSGDISPELLDLVSRMSTPSVQQAAYNQGLAIGAQSGSGFGAGFLSGLPPFLQALLLGDFNPEFPAFDSAFHPVGNPVIPLPEDEGGTRSVTNVIISTPRMPTTDIARGVQIVKAIAG